MKVYTPTKARENIYSIIKDVVEYNTPVEIVNMKNEKENVVMISKEDYNSIQETLYLINNGIDKIIEERKDDELVSIEDIDWDIL